MPATASSHCQPCATRPSDAPACTYDLQSLPNGVVLDGYIKWWAPGELGEHIETRLWWTPGHSSSDGASAAARSCNGAVPAAITSPVTTTSIQRSVLLDAASAVLSAPVPEAVLKKPRL